MGAAIGAGALCVFVVGFANAFFWLEGQDDGDPFGRGVVVWIVMLLCGPAVAVVSFVAGGSAAARYILRRRSRRPARGFEVITERIA